MNFATVRWGALCVVCAGLGFWAGAFSTRTLYGDPAASGVRPAKERPVECPPCSPCPICPPPPVCEDGRLVPADTELPEDGLGDGASAGDLPEDDPSGLPGLSVATVRAAEAAVSERVQTCREVARGTAVLELTLTVTGTTGVVSDAFVTRSRLDDAEGERCLEAAARGARFPGDQDGSSVLKLPVQLSPDGRP